MEIKPERIALIEDSTTSYGFIGNNRKPFYTCTWLCPKAIPSTEGVKGDAGNEAKGTAGFCFYENYLFFFISIYYYYFTIVVL